MQTDQQAGSAHFVACTLGTRGDIRPFVPILKQLVGRGHTVDLLTNENWSAFANEIGCSFYPIAPADPPQNGRDDKLFFRANILPSFSASFDHVGSLVERGVRPILLSRVGMLGIACAAERFQLKSIRVALQPSAIPSRSRPPWPLTFLALGRLGILGRWTAVPLLYAFLDLFSPYRSDLLAFRRSVGLPARPRAAQSQDLLLVLCPDWFALPQPDWPAESKCVGFPYEQADHAVEADIAQIVLTPGTGVTDASLYVEYAEAISARFSVPCLVLSPHCQAGPVPGSQVEVAHFRDLATVLPGAVALVHHGGIGTTAEAIRAGVPQLVIAGRFDQPDNAVRVAQLGLGGGILLDKPEPQVVVDALAEVVRSVHVAQQVSTAARLAGASDAVAQACEAIVGLIAVSADVTSDEVVIPADPITEVEGAGLQYRATSASGRRD